MLWYSPQGDYLAILMWLGTYNGTIANMTTIERHPFFITLEQYGGSLGKFSTLCFRHIQDIIPQCMLLAHDVVLADETRERIIYEVKMCSCSRF